MKRTLHISAMVVAAVMAVGCNPADELDDRFAGESVAVFQPVLSSNAVSVETKASELVSEDGSISIPLSCTVSDGIFGNPSLAQTAIMDGMPLTKGEQKNTTGEVDALENYVTEFYVAGWKGTSVFIPAYQKVEKRDGVFQTVTEYMWPSASEATFYGYANLPESGVSVSSTAGSQTLTYTAVPDNAGDQNDILLGFFRGKGRFDETLFRGGIADMTFCHPLTAVRFKMGTFSGATSVTIKSITMEGVYDSGEAIMQPASATATTAPVTWNCSGSGTKTVTLDNGDTGWTVAAGEIIGEPFILIPQDFTSNAVKIKVVASIDGGSDITLTTSREAVWEAGKTNTYTLKWTNLPKGALPEAFSVSPTKKVYFSKGNLQATYLGESGHYIWNFAENQYDFIGNAPGNTRVSSLVSGDVVDLFRWSYTTNCYGIEGDDYTGVFKDWGIAFGTSNGIATDLWRTLSHDEFRYLFGDLRDPSDLTREGLYACGVTVAGHTNCIVLYPDGYTGTKVENGDTESYDTLEEWIAAEKTGVVCLPAAGRRSNNSVSGCNSTIRYWLSDTVSGGYPWTIYYEGSMGFSSNASPVFAYAVRLVTDAN